MMTRSISIRRGLALSALLLTATLSALLTATAQTSRTPPAQNPPQERETTVEATGQGVAQADALKEALRAAVAQAAGVAIRSQTTVENFAVVQDAIAARSEGYIAGYEILSERPVAGGGRAVTVRARVTNRSLSADANLLAQSLGGMRWLVAYDPRQVSEADRPLYQQVLEGINGELARRRYRYIEPRRFDQLITEAANMAEDQANRQASTITYAQRLGQLSGAQFMILIGRVTTDVRSEAFDTRQAKRLSIEAQAYDNCTGEGLGIVRMQGDFASARTTDDAQAQGLSQALEQGMPQLLGQVNSYIGGWIQNGTPYELRFYNLGGFRDLRTLRSRLQSDALHGGELEMTSVDNYTRINGTFRRRPEDMADRILELADEIPDLKPRRLDVKYMFGRQINFAPRNERVPELEGLASAAGAGAGSRPTPDARATPVKGTPSSVGPSLPPARQTPARPAAKPAPKPAAKPATKAVRPKQTIPPPERR